MRRLAVVVVCIAFLITVGGSAIFLRTRYRPANAVRKTITEADQPPGAIPGKENLSDASTSAVKVPAAPAPPSLSDQFPQSTAEVVQGPTLEPADFATAVVQELAQIRTDSTVGKWRTDHPSDTWHRQAYDSPAEDNFGDYCAVFKLKKNSSGGSSFVRTAAFLIPEAPASKALPDDSQGPELIENGCLLGIIRIHIIFATQAALETTNEAIRSALSSRFGNPSDEPDPLSGLPNRQLVSIWKNAEVMIEFPPRYSAGYEQQFDLAVVSYLVNYPHGLSYRLPLFEPFTVGNLPDIFELALSTAALGPDLSERMRYLYSGYARRPPQYETEVVRRTETPAEVASLLQNWLHASADLAPQRRAAAILAADFVLEEAWPHFQDGSHDLGETESRPFESAGIAFIHGAPDGTVPELRWLAQARDLDPNGPIGDAVTRMSLSPGDWLRWLQPATCQGDIDCLADYIIQAGMKYLSRPREPLITANIEERIASAYSDRLAVSQGAGSGCEGGVTLPTQAQVEDARGAGVEALRHYRSMLAIDRTSGHSMQAWFTAWKIMAGLPLEIHNSLGCE